jgi:hypothetical protein
VYFWNWLEAFSGRIGSFDFRKSLIIEFLKSRKFLSWESKLQEFQKMPAGWRGGKELISGRGEVV